MANNFYFQDSPFVVPTTDGKYIAEHFGHATDQNHELSVAHMKAPPHWSEAPQTPSFDEYTIVVKGRQQVVVNGEITVVSAGQSIKVLSGVQVQYSNPFDEECEYIAICTPAFSVETAGREE